MFFRMVSILNFSRGILLFLIFVCKRTVWKELQKIRWIHTVSSKFIRTKKDTNKSMETLHTDIKERDELEEDEQIAAKTVAAIDENKKEVDVKQSSTNLFRSTLV